MKKIMIIIRVLMLILGIISCSKEKSCPGFEMTNEIEFPYLTADTITFINESAELFHIYISEAEQSAPYTFECRDLYNICPCMNYIEVQVTDSRESGSYIFLRMEQSAISEMQYYKYNLCGFEFEFDFINELPNIDQMKHLKYLPELEIGDLVYKDVIEITNIDQTAANISKVYFNRGDGILRYIERTTSSVWSIQQ